MSQNNTIVTTDNQDLAAINDIRKLITSKHKQVSDKKTPKPFVKKKMGMDYVEYSVMRDIADKEYAGWSWTIINTEVLGSEAFVVHGRLKWYDEGIWRECDMTAAHRIQKKRGTNEFVDIGNDVKSANTDCIKKAFNMYLNICDDVYRNQIEDLSLTKEQKDTIITVSSMVSDTRFNEITEMVKEQTIHLGNYASSLLKLEREAKKVNND